jgi:hypothetical protein
MMSAGPAKPLEMLDWLHKVATQLSGQDVPAGAGPYVSLASWALSVIGIPLGLVVILYGLQRFLVAGARPALLISLAIIAGGPGEDIAEAFIARRGTPEAVEALTFLLDRVTSVIFLLCLALAIRWVDPPKR